MALPAIPATGVGNEARKLAAELIAAIKPGQRAERRYDVEDFLVEDPVFADRQRFPDHSGSEWATAERERHPKHYLRFLCQTDPLDPFRRSYREGKQGAQALATMPWPQVLAHPVHTRLLRALLDDLSEGLGGPRLAGEVHPATARKAGPQAVLRNLRYVLMSGRWARRSIEIFLAAVDYEDALRERMSEVTEPGGFLPGAVYRVVWSRPPHTNDNPSS